MNTTYEKNLANNQYCILAPEIVLSSPYGYKRIPFLNIMYLHKCGKYIEITFLKPSNIDINFFGIHLQNNDLGISYTIKETIRIRGTLSRFCIQFPPFFGYVKRSYFVNVLHIIDFTNKTLRMRDLTEINYSKDRSAHIRFMWKQFIKVHKV